MANYPASWPPLTASLNYTIAYIAGYGEEIGVPLTKADIDYQLSHYYDSKAGSLIAGTVVMLVASTAAVVLRLLSRRLKGTKLGADDYMAIAGIVCLLHPEYAE